MACSQSTRSFSRDHTRNERGYVLLTALVIAFLYLGLIELLLIDGTRALHEAQRLRSKVIAATLAENAAELAAEQMVVKYAAKVTEKNIDGTIAGAYSRNGNQFELTGSATSAGVAPEEGYVHLQGRIEGNEVKIDYATHKQ